MLTDNTMYKSNLKTECQKLREGLDDKNLREGLQFGFCLKPSKSCTNSKVMSQHDLYIVDWSGGVKPQLITQS